VRNEAWILHAFLKATSLWADYVIIADQNSTDGSREIAKQYSKVILVDNTAKEMHQASARKLLFEAAKKIEGDKILFALDADEFLSGYFMKTEAWHKIMHSKPGEVFAFRWINLLNPPSKYTSHIHYYWACHPTEELMSGTFPDNYIHEWRLPWPDGILDENVHNIDDISFIHFARVNDYRQRNKEIYYQISTLLKEPNKSLVSIHRLYYSDINLEVFNVDESIYSYYLENKLDLMKEIDLNDEGAFYIEMVLNAFKENGYKCFSGLDIWNKGFLSKHNVKDPRSLGIKLLHLYLNKTAKKRTTFAVRVIDKILRVLGF